MEIQEALEEQGGRRSCKKYTEIHCFRYFVPICFVSFMGPFRDPPELSCGHSLLFTCCSSPPLQIERPLGAPKNRLRGTWEYHQKMRNVPGIQTVAFLVQLLSRVSRVGAQATETNVRSLAKDDALLRVWY